VSNATHSLKEQRQGKVGVIGKGVLGNIHTHINTTCHTPIFCRVAEAKTNTVVLTFCLFLGVSFTPAFTSAAAAPSTA